GDHRTRSTGVMIEVLDTEPEWDRLGGAHGPVTQPVPSRRGEGVEPPPHPFTPGAPRLGERVFEPPLPLVLPAWSPDPHFALAYHLQRVRLPGGGSKGGLPALWAQLGRAARD